MNMFVQGLIRFLNIKICSRTIPLSSVKSWTATGLFPSRITSGVTDRWARWRTAPPCKLNIKTGPPPLLRQRHNAAIGLFYKPSFGPRSNLSLIYPLYRSCSSSSPVDTLQLRLHLIRILLQNMTSRMFLGCLYLRNRLFSFIRKHFSLLKSWRFCRFRIIIKRLGFLNNFIVFHRNTGFLHCLIRHFWRKLNWRESAD